MSAPGTPAHARRMERLRILKSLGVKPTVAHRAAHDIGWFRKLVTEQGQDPTQYGACAVPQRPGPKGPRKPKPLVIEEAGWDPSRAVEP